MLLGEQLVSEGVVTQEAVNTALREQVVSGGRLGTNLVDLGALRIDDLGEALAKQHGCSIAHAKHFESRDESLAPSIDDVTAAMLHVIPLYLSGDDADSIVIASTDPLSPDFEAELVKIFKKKIIIGIAPELRILYWLEKVYGIQRSNRFKRSEPGIKPQSSQERRQLIQTLSDESAPEPLNPLAKIAVRRVTLTISPDVERGPKPTGLKEIMRSIKRSNQRSDIGKLVTNALREEFEQKINTGILLVCRKEIALGWQGFIRDRENSSTIESIAVPLAEPSMLHRVYSKKMPHTKGPLEDPQALDVRLQNLLDTPPPEDMATFPIVLNDRVIALLYVESAQRLSDDDLVGLRSISDAIAAAFKRLILASQR